MPATTTFLQVAALPLAELARIRRAGHDDFGNPLAVTVVRESQGTPLRCCLRDAKVGERVTLIAYQPATLGGPYAEVGPVFIHTDACDGYPTPDRYPEAYRSRPQVLRAYTADGRIADAQLAEDGDAAEKICAAFFARPDIAYIHSRNMLYGCYMFSVQRPEAAREQARRQTRQAATLI